MTIYRSPESGYVIHQLVKRILYELSKTPMAVASYIVGHKNKIEELFQLLNVKSNGIRTLGIWGMGCIGKTTLVKVLYNKKLVAQFENRSFISNVKETYEKYPNGLASLQIKLRSDLSLGNGAYGTRVLVVLDDVDDASRLMELATWWKKCFDEGSRIIITTRNKRILVDCHIDIVYRVTKLSPSDSLELFLPHALRSKIPSEKRLKLSRDIVLLTEGLPLAVELFGSFLFDKRRDEEWEDSVEKLKKIRPGHLQDVLRISLDGLDEELKCIFLDISCLFVILDMKLENAIDILKGCGFKAEISIKILIERALIRTTESSRLWMHDQIRDMGRQIVQLENADFCKHSRLWDRGEISNVLQNGKGNVSIVCNKRGDRYPSHFMKDKENGKVTQPASDDIAISATPVSEAPPNINIYTVPATQVHMQSYEEAHKDEAQNNESHNKENHNNEAHNNEDDRYMSDKQNTDTSSDSGEWNISDLNSAHNNVQDRFIKKTSEPFMGKKRFIIMCKIGILLLILLEKKGN